MDVTQNESSNEDALLYCRGCLSTDGRLFNMHEYKLADAFENITGISVDNDKLTQYLCVYCATQLHKSASFRNMCLLTQKSLTSEQVKEQLVLEDINKLNSHNQFLDLTLTEVQNIECIDVATDTAIEFINTSPTDTTNIDCEDTADIDLPLIDTDQKDINVILEPNFNFADIDFDYTTTRTNQRGNFTGSKYGYKNQKPILVSDVNPAGTCVEKMGLENQKHKSNVNNNEHHEPNVKLDPIDGNREKTDLIMKDVKQKLDTNNHKTKEQNVKFVRVEGIIKKGDSKVEYENQMQVLNISKDKLKYIKNRMRTIGNSIKKKMATAIGEKNGSIIPGDIKINIETKNNVEVNGVSNVNIIRMPIKVRPEKLRKTAELKRKIDMKMVMKSRKRKRRRPNRRDPENNYLPVFDFAKFESDYKVSILTLSKEEQLEEIASRKKSQKYAFQCETCGKGFQMEPAFNNHRNRHSPSEGAWPCEICSVRFRRNGLRQKHQDTHRLKLICKLCGFVSRHRDKAQKHHDMHEGKTYQCRHCEKTFIKHTTYFAHTRLLHPTLNVPCNLCGDIFIGPRGLKLHQKIAHKKTQQEFKCTTCSATFLNVQALNRHTDTAGEHKQLRPCEQCGENCASEEALHQHVKDTHPEESYRCDKCDISFLTASALATHQLRSHPPSKRKREREDLPRSDHASLVCEQCGLVTKNATLLRYHLMRDHQAVKQFPCSQCPKGFLFEAGLRYHMRSHTGERPFQCPACPRAFSSKNNLKRHHLTAHQGIRDRIPCGICERVFSTKGSMALHVSTVHAGRPWPRRNRNRNRNRRPDTPATSQPDQAESLQ